MTDDDRLPFGEIEREEFKKLYSWCADDARAAQREEQKKNPDKINRPGPVTRWMAIKWMEAHRKHYLVSGDPYHILATIDLCAGAGLALPAWCARGFITAYNEVMAFKAESWDDVFGKPNLKGTHIGRKREQREKQGKVYILVKEREAGVAIDDGLFERIGEELGISGSRAKRYYYEIKNSNNFKTFFNV